MKLEMDKNLKRRIEELLRMRDFDALVEICEKDRHYWQQVRFRLYDLDEQLRWAAIETVARMMKRWWKMGQEEKVRIYIRTLFWSINDESGGIGWSAPQTIAEIIINIPELIDPYGSMIIAHSIEEPPLMKSGLWGIGRLGKKLADSMDYFKDKVLASFKSDDVEILGLASWAMGEVCFKPALPLLQGLQNRKEEVSIYIEGDFSEKPLGKWAEEAVCKIKNCHKNKVDNC